MNKEQYVTFEVAKYLKENGFDWFTFYSYEVYNGNVQLRVTNGVDTGFPLFPRPTQQKAMRWLSSAASEPTFVNTATSFFMSDRCR